MPPAQNQNLPPSRQLTKSTKRRRTTIPDTCVLTLTLGTNYPKAVLPKAMACQSGDQSDTLHQDICAEVNSTRTIYPASHPRL